MLKLKEFDKAYPNHLVALFDKANALQEEGQASRFALTRILVQLGKQNLQTVIPLLEKALQSNQTELRLVALHELLELGRHNPQEVVGLLEQSIKCEPSKSGRLHKTRVLVELGQKNPQQIIPIFEKALQSDNIDLQWTGLLELIDLAEKFPHMVIPILERVLASENPHLKWAAVLELMELAKDHPDWVIPTLTKALSDDAFYNPTLKPHSSPSLCVNANRLAELKAGLQSTDPDIQCEALLGLTELVPEHPEEILPLFEEALRCHNPDLQWMIILELVKLTQTHPNEVIPILRRVLQEGEKDIKETRVLIEMGKEDFQQVLPCFEEALQLDNQKLHAAAILELFELLRIHLQKLAPLLKKALRDRTLIANIEPHKSQLQQIINLLEKALLNCHPDLQWTTLQRFLELKILEPQQIVRMIDNMVQRQVNAFQNYFEHTRVLVELGQQYPRLAAPIFRQALANADADLQWAAILELVAVTRLCPQIMAYLNEPNCVYETSLS